VDPDNEFIGVSLPDLVRKYKEVQAQRLEMDRISDLLKKGPEAKIKEAMIDYLMNSDQLSAKVKVDDYNVTLAIKSNKQVRFTDVEKACRHMFENMKVADKEKRPLTDHLLTQKTPLKSEILKWAEGEVEKDGGDPDDTNLLLKKLEQIGFTLALIQDISITQSKGK
jgi:hypothetical protein